jgi:hypothetical protein
MRSTSIGLGLLATLLGGCGTDASSPVVDSGTVDASVDVVASDATPADANLADGALDPQARISAAKTTASSNAFCTKITPFYWEIGNAQGAIVSASAGNGSVSANSTLDIASASKLWWGAYVVERFKADLTQVDLPSMTMQSGRTNLVDCVGTTTVAQCCAKKGKAGVGTTACDVESADVDHFDYNGGHFEGYGVTLGLGSSDATALAVEYTKVLGADLHPGFKSPLLAGGMQMNAADYAPFLRKILSGGLAIHDHLGEHAVCTLPGASCPSAHYSPSPLAWHYSYGHFVEDDPDTGDGAFSSPGLYGFYPWIDASKTYYGLVARESIVGIASPNVTDTPYYLSAQCGRAIRKAFMTGVAQ